MLKINDIAQESELVFQQLGRVVHKQLEGAAEIWYWSLPIKYRVEIEENWDTLRKVFAVLTGYSKSNLDEEHTVEDRLVRGASKKNRTKNLAPLKALSVYEHWSEEWLSLG
jgi:hypothetical protein